MRVSLADATQVVRVREIVERAYGISVARIGRRPAPMDDDYARKTSLNQVFVGADQGEVAGLLVLVIEQDHLLIESIAVDPDCQGTGIGRALMAYAETYAIDRGIAELRLYTNEAMTENLAFYSRLGYSEYARRTEYDLKRVFLRKAIDPPPTRPRGQPDTAPRVESSRGRI